MTRVSTIAAGLAAMLFAGCYRYAPAEPDSLAPGQQVRATLTPEGAEALRPVLGPDLDALRGRFVERREPGFVLDISRQVRAGDYPATVVQETLTLEPFHVRTFEVRELDALRSSLFAGALVAGTIVAVAGTKRLFGGGEGGEPPGGDPIEGRWPLWILRLRAP